MAQEIYKVSLELLPGSPQQKYVVGLIEEYLSDMVDEPGKVALHIWQLTRTKIRPVPPVIH